MDINLLLTIIGTFVTLVGTGITIWQVSKARKYKDQTKRYLSQRVLLGLVPKANRSREDCRKIITPVNKPLRGIDDQKVINNIQDFVEELRDNSFYSKNKSDIDNQANEIMRLINEYRNANDKESRYLLGDSIYGTLNSIVYKINAEIGSISYE